MDDKNSLNKCTSSPIEHNVDQSAGLGTSSDEFVGESSTGDADLRPTSASRSQLDRERHQTMEESFIQLGNSDVVCGRGFPPDSKKGLVSIQKVLRMALTTTFSHFNWLMSQAFLVTLGCIGSLALIGQCTTLRPRSRRVIGFIVSF